MGKERACARYGYGGAISLDGYIAGPNGETDWIVIDPDIDFAAMFKQYDTLLIGRRTFTGMVDAGRGSMLGMQVYVFSTTLRQEDYPDVTMVDTGAGEVVRELRQRPGKDIALFGGASLFRSLLDAGQVDTVEVSLIPVLLGAGVPLMPPPYGPVALRLVKQRVLPTTGTNLVGVHDTSTGMCRRLVIAGDGRSAPDVAFSKQRATRSLVAPIEVVGTDCRR